MARNGEAFDRNNKDALAREKAITLAREAERKQAEEDADFEWWKAREKDRKAEMEKGAEQMSETAWAGEGVPEDARKKDFEKTPASFKQRSFLRNLLMSGRCKPVLTKAEITEIEIVGPDVFLNDVSFATASAYISRVMDYEKNINSETERLRAQLAQTRAALSEAKKQEKLAKDIFKAPERETITGRVRLDPPADFGQLGKRKIEMDDNYSEGEES